jgi:putative transposase
MGTKPTLTSLTDEERAQAQKRFAFLQPHLEEGISLSELARQAGIPLRTARRWRARYKQEGLVGLARQRRSDRATRRKVTPEIQQVIEGLALRKPRPSSAFVHRQIQTLAEAQGWPVPSYRTVADIISQLDPGLICLAHEGERGYSERYDLLHRWEASRPNELWQADHTLLDVWLLNPPGKATRPWMTVILDDHSRAVAGYYVSFQHPSSQITALALRQAIWRKEDPRWHICGIPEAFYSDHGKDFTSQHLEQISAELKMRLIFSEKGEPRGRGKIERFFGTVNELFLRVLAGYGKAAPITEASLSLPVFDSLLRTFLITNYHTRIHEETNMMPQARWEANGFIPLLPESRDQLDLLLLTVARTRRVQQDGIRFHGYRYMDVNLAGYIGEDVVIRYDPRDMAEIQVYHQNVFICRAICQELAGQIITLKEIQQARRERRRTLRSELTDRQAVVERYLAVHRADEPAVPSTPPADPSVPRLKRYINE